MVLLYNTNDDDDDDDDDDVSVCLSLCFFYDKFRNNLYDYE